MVPGAGSEVAVVNGAVVAVNWGINIFDFSTPATFNNIPTAALATIARLVRLRR